MNNSTNYNLQTTTAAVGESFSKQTTRQINRAFFNAKVKQRQERQA